jgi:hypothetical protein
MKGARPDNKESTEYGLQLFLEMISSLGLDLFCVYSFAHVKPESKAIV